MICRWSLKFVQKISTIQQCSAKTKLNFRYFSRPLNFAHKITPVAWNHTINCIQQFWTFTDKLNQRSTSYTSRLVVAYSLPDLIQSACLLWRQTFGPKFAIFIRTFQMTSEGLLGVLLVRSAVNSLRSRNFTASLELEQQSNKIQFKDKAPLQLPLPISVSPSHQSPIYTPTRSFHQFTVTLK